MGNTSKRRRTRTLGLSGSASFGDAEAIGHVARNRDGHNIRIEVDPATSEFADLFAQWDAEAAAEKKGR